ncbi:PD-(D/E)XK nuclease-like domain-containing protein [Nocardia sp. NPDC049149]|uniref:PD-(D/E)XK nuclease-like domain-containing protein n=1 Tax=Nocardia sp. NPDC049149 TaxID=3364315 RepID=UPI0037161B3C
MTEVPAVHDCPFCMGAGCPRCGGGEVDDRELCQAPSEPGMYADIPNEVYHADRNSLSSSGARHLLATCPAQFHHDLHNPREYSQDYFDVGTAFHTLLFGVGPEIVEIKENDWRKDAAKDAQAKAWADGKTPLLSKQLLQVKAMVEAARENDIAATLLSEGMAEHSLYWRDKETGVMLRARPDWMCRSGNRLIIVDGKSADTSAPQAFSKAAVNLGYAMQGDFYRRGVIALGMDPDPGFLFLVVAKTLPHLVSVIELDADALAYGAARNRRAIDLYADCRETGTWPDWGSDVHLVSLPRWTYHAEESSR